MINIDNVLNKITYKTRLYILLCLKMRLVRIFSHEKMVRKKHTLAFSKYCKNKSIINCVLTVLYDNYKLRGSLTCKLQVQVFLIFSCHLATYLSLLTNCIVIYNVLLRHLNCKIYSLIWIFTSKKKILMTYNFKDILNQNFNIISNCPMLTRRIENFTMFNKVLTYFSFVRALQIFGNVQN